jgi:hypothetical protein
MIAAFFEAGHDVLLIVRDFAGSLAKDLFPAARVLQCVGSPYERDFSLSTPLGQELLEELRTFSPELFVVASFQHTQLEELAAAQIPNVDCVGFTGYLFQARPEITAVSAIRFVTQVAVGRDSAELEKNELLCAAVLGHSVELDRPRMEARPQALAEATAQLRELGLNGHPFWAVCAGDAPNKGVRNWRGEQWAEFCRELAGNEGATLLFVGSPDEHAGTVEIQNAMGEAGLRTATITGAPVKLDVLVAILQLSSGYIGKDTGPMHIAAALEKPVLAVFGGGTWPRFIPAAKTGAVFTLNVPCTGCDWQCHLSRSHCVKDIPVERVLRKAKPMLRGELSDFSVEILEPGRVLSATIVRDLLSSVRMEQRKVAAERANFLQWHDDRIRDISQLKSGFGELEAERNSIAAQLQAREDRVQQLLAVEDRARSLEDRTATLEFESRLAVSNRRQAIDDQTAAERRLERVRQLAVRKIADARTKALAVRTELEALRTANAALEIAAERANAEAAGWKREWDTAAGQLSSLRERLEEKTILATSLQMRVDTEDSRFEGLIADHEQLVKRKSVELASALALIPDLRDELAALSADLAVGRVRITQLERSLETREQLVAQLELRCKQAEKDQESEQKLMALSSENLRAITEDHAARLVVIETLAKELEDANYDRAAKQESVDSIRRQFQVSEADRERRLELIDRLSKELETIEADRADRGEQIGKLHEHITNQQAELAALRNLLPYRILKRLHIL